METIAIIVTICVFVGGILWYVITEPKRKEREKREKEEEKIRRQEEKEKWQDIKRIEKQYETLELAKKNGKLLMAFYGDVKEGMKGAVCLFLDKSGIVVTDYANRMLAQKIRFSVVEMDNDTYSYHPAKLVYTGASAGGFHTGGFHTEGAYYTQGHRKSGRGAVCCTVAGKKRPIMFIEVNEPALKKALSGFTRGSGSHEALTKYFGKGKSVIPLLKLDSKERSFFEEAALAQNNTYNAAMMMSLAQTSTFLTMEECQACVQVLNKLMEQIEENGAEKVIESYSKRD